MAAYTESIPSRCSTMKQGVRSPSMLGPSKYVIHSSPPIRISTSYTGCIRHKRTLLPNDLRMSPLPSSAQKVHPKISENSLQPELATPARTSTPRTSTPSQNLLHATSLPAPIASTSKADYLQLRPIISQLVTFGCQSGS